MRQLHYRCVWFLYQGVVCSDTSQLIFTGGQIENFVKGGEVGRISRQIYDVNICVCMYVCM